MGQLQLLAGLFIFRLGAGDAAPKSGTSGGGKGGAVVVMGSHGKGGTGMGGGGNSNTPAVPNGACVFCGTNDQGKGNW